MYCFIVLYRLNCLIVKVDMRDYSLNISKRTLHVKNVRIMCK